MKTIFEIQKIDGQILQLKKQISDSPANKRTKELIDFMHEGRSFIAKTNKYAETLINELNTLQAKYTNAVSKTEIVTKQSVDSIAEENLTDTLTEVSGLSAEIAKLENRIKALTENITHLIQDYNNAMNKLRVAKEQIAKLKTESASISDKLTPQIQSLEAQKKELEVKADAEKLKLYSKLRAENIYPVFVHIKGNQCGGCHMELSLNFIERLKTKGMLQCEECHRYILSD